MSNFKNELMRCDANKKKHNNLDSVCKEKTHHDAYKN